MPTPIDLEQALEQILDSIVESLEAERKPGGKLEEIEEIVRGDRSRPRPNTPCLWVFPETAQPDASPRTLAETWSLPVVITPVVKSDDPEEGYKLATRYAARARSILIKNRTLGLRNFVQDTKSSRFEASAPWHRRDNLFSAVAGITVKFVILEH